MKQFDKGNDIGVLKRGNDDAMSKHKQLYPALTTSFRTLQHLPSMEKELFPWFKHNPKSIP